MYAGNNGSFVSFFCAGDGEDLTSQESRKLVACCTEPVLLFVQRHLTQETLTVRIFTEPSGPINTGRKFL